MTGKGPPGGDDGRSASRNSEPILTGLPFRPASVPAPAPSAPTGPLAVQPAPGSHPSSPPPTYAGPQAIKPAPQPVQSIEAAAASVRTPKQTARLVATAAPSAPPPAPPPLVRSAPPHVDKSEWQSPLVPQKRAPEVPVHDVAPPAWTQGSDWNAHAASNAAAKESWMPSASQSALPPPAAAPIIPPPSKAPASGVGVSGAGGALTASARLSESIGAPPGFVAPAMELVFYDDTFFSHLRRHFRVLCEEMEPDPDRSFSEDVAEVLHILAASARATDPKVVAAHAQRRVGAGALPPIEVWDGVLSLEVDPIERLRLEVEAARRVLGPSSDAASGLALELSRAIALVQADLDSASGLSARRAVIRLRELREHIKGDPKRDEEQVLDLLEKRAYRSVELFGGTQVRATLKVGSQAMTVYIAASAANALPLLPSVNVTAITERRARQEQDAASDIALHVRALARHVGK